MTRWDRHRPDCNGKSAKTGNVCNGCQGGKRDRNQRRMYCLMVLAQLNQEPVSEFMTCPLTGMPFDIESGEVDRINPQLGYVPGNVCLVSGKGNSARSQLQSLGRDLERVSQYTHDVLVASQYVIVPTLTMADQWAANRPRADPIVSLTKGRYM